MINTKLLTLNKKETNYKVIISRFYDIIKTKFHNFAKIYIDASKSEHKVGLAVVLIQINIHHKLPHINTIFTAENYAILEVIKLANSLHETKINDSLSTLTFLKCFWLNHDNTQKTQSV